MKLSTIKRISFSTTTIIILFIIWAILANVNQGNFLYPTLGQIIKTLFKEFTKANVLNYLYTIFRVIIACASSIIIATLIIVLYLKAHSSFAFFSPIIVILKTIPFIAISLFIILLFLKVKVIGAIVISFILTLPIGVETLKMGVDNIPRSITDDLATLDVNFFLKLFKVYLPILAPYFLLVVLETFGLGFKVMIMAEFFMQLKNSVGFMFNDAKVNLDMDRLIAYSIVTILIVSINDLIVKKVAKKIKIDY